MALPRGASKSNWVILPRASSPCDTKEKNNSYLYVLRPWRKERLKWQDSFLCRARAPEMGICSTRSPACMVHFEPVRPLHAMSWHAATKPIPMPAGSPGSLRDLSCETLVGRLQPDHRWESSPVGTDRDPNFDAMALDSAQPSRYLSGSMLYCLNSSQ